LTKSKIIAGVIGILSLLGCVFGFYAGIRAGIIDEYVNVMGTQQIGIHLLTSVFVILLPWNPS
jgi:hypothetical protein